MDDVADARAPNTPDVSEDDASRRVGTSIRGEEAEEEEEEEDEEATAMAMAVARRIRRHRDGV